MTVQIKELLAHNTARSWKTEGKDRLVKICGIAAAQSVRKYNSVIGYVTQEKYLYGKTAAEIEKLLGLRIFELRNIAYIFSLARLPRLGEFEYKFATSFPDGRVFEGAHFDELMDARADYLAGRNLTERSLTPVVQHYPPGSSMIPQWKITEPVPLGGLIATVTVSCPFPRDNGSIKPYTPHNRGPIR